MRIISVRRGFASDHSSTSYEFLAVDRPLSREARAQVRAISSRAAPTKRRVRFIYHVEGYDIPGGWEPLLRRYYDVMYSESYDWWTLGFAFNAPEAQQQEIAQYDFEGIDGQGVYVSTHDQRVVVSIFCRLDAGAMAGFETRWGEEYWDDEEEDDDEGNLDVVCEDELLNFLAEIRRQLMDGDYRALYAVWQEYGWEDEEREAEAMGNADQDDWPTPPEPPYRPTDGHLVERLRDMLATP